MLSHSTAGPISEPTSGCHVAVIATALSLQIGFATQNVLQGGRPSMGCARGCWGEPSLSSSASLMNSCWRPHFSHCLSQGLRPPLRPRTVFSDFPPLSLAFFPISCKSDVKVLQISTQPNSSICQRWFLVLLCCFFSFAF